MKRIIKSTKNTSKFEPNSINMQYYPSKEFAEKACKLGRDLAKKHMTLMNFLKDK